MMTVKDEKKINLVLNKVSEQTYDQLSSESKLQDNQIYVVGDDDTKHLDVPTKAYVDKSSSLLSSDLVQVKESLSSDYIKKESETQQDINSDVQINGYLRIGGISVTGSGGGGSPYVLKEIVPVISTNGLSCQIDNYTISTIRITNASTQLSVYLPPQASNDNVRDFTIRFENVASSNASVIFIPYGQEEIDYESDSDDWAVVEPGVNLISFTETKR